MLALRINQRSFMPKKVTKNAAIKALGQAVLLVIKGCQNGAIKCKSAIVSINPEAEQLKPISLEDRMWEALVSSGLYVNKDKEAK